MRGFYGLARADIARVLSALLDIEHITIEDRQAVSAVLDLFAAVEVRNPATAVL